MQEIKPDIIDIILLDKKYKNKENEIDKLIIEVYNLYQEITEFKNIDFESIDIENIDRYNFPFSEEETEKINQLNSNYDENLISIILGIFSIINEMKSVSEELEDYRLKNYDLKLMEHDINNVYKQINILKTNLEQAIVLNNENEKFKHEFAIEMYQKFQKDKTNALALYKIFFQSVYYQLSLSPLEKEKMYSLKRKNGERINKELDEKVERNVDYFFNIYCLINGYLLNSKKIHKSSALRIYNLINDNLNVNKNPLADKVSHLFARLEIDINLDYRKAHNIRKISIYHDYTIYDYSTNKKDTDLYFSIDEIANKLTGGVKKELQKTNFPLNEIQTNKKAVYLSNIEAFQNDYKKTKYIID